MTAKKCQMCGAPLHGNQCEYCGTEYTEDEKKYSRLYADGVCIMEIPVDEEQVNDAFLLVHGMATPNDVRKMRGLPPIDEMEMKYLDR